MKYVVYTDNGDSMIKDREFNNKKNAISYAHMIGVIENICATVEDTKDNQIIYENKVQRDENKRRYGD
jgi:hypothetical protein